MEERSNSTQILTASFSLKVREQIELTQELIGLIPAEKLEWRPCDESFRTGELLGHLLECLAGFCAVLYALRPDELAHFKQLRGLPVNHFCEIKEAQERFKKYETCIKEGFEGLSDSDLAKKITTIFVTEGETALTLFLGNLEHLINHKHQLFFYLKLLGVEISTENLYQFRGA